MKNIILTLKLILFNLIIFFINSVNNTKLIRSFTDDPIDRELRVFLILLRAINAYAANLWRIRKSW